MIFNRIKYKKRQGFTLVELVIVVTILGILSGLGFMKFDKVQLKARQNADYIAAANLATAVSLYKCDNPYSLKVTKYNEKDTIELKELKDSSYIKLIPKPQSLEGDFTVELDEYDNIYIKVGEETFFPKEK